MSIHKEISFENDICSHLDNHGWIYEHPSADRYDRTRALFPEDIAAWVQASQPDAWDTLIKAHGTAAITMLADRLRAALDKQGTLAVLRDGLDVIGLKTSLVLCRFRPALAMNETLQAQYAANRLRVIRQVRYSQHSEACIDLVLFLNGIPVATVELKSDYTQSVDDAVDQYRYDRLPRSSVGNKAEPLLSFPGGALVHFAVSNSLVRMCTKLQGADSHFLPFDRGNDYGAGNAPNPNGAPTAYLWEDVWQRDSWLEILGRYIVPQRNEKKQLTDWLFPRFHQLDATRKLVASVREEGAGGKYLVEHSAGSGKTNSISWTAHFLADLHDDQNQKVFDTVLVVSDRTVLDRQLRESIEGFERTLGVVASVTGDGASKSSELAKALSAGKKIVICTVQTFPFALDEVRKLAKAKKSRFAVIADEAHSSQSGKASAEMRMVLTAEEQAELADGGEYSTEDILAAKMVSRADADSGITFVAFTATPKAKTLELFGRRPHPDRAVGKDNLPEAFHIYSMRQAIEEGFILDVLRNYTSYKMAFKLTHNGQELDDKAVDASEARKGIMGWVRLHPTNIAARVQIVVEHFRQNVAHLLGGQAKAMVVTGSRKEAVRWSKQMAGYIKLKDYGIGLLTAFSGEVDDSETEGGPFTEANMNPDLLGRDIKDALRTAKYSILLVANKYQTGFDEPLLSAMYVDRKLGGIQAVQTLSRLNRAMPSLGKDTTYVVDFSNEPADILAAFRQYHRTAQLADVSDPNVVLDLRNKLDALGYYDQHEVDRVARAVTRPKASQADLDAAIGPVSNRLLVRFKAAQKAAREQPDKSPAQKAGKDEMEALLLFKRDLLTYVRVYEFMGQMFDYGNTAYEKLYLFGRMLTPLLDYGRERDGLDLSGLRLSHHKMRDLGQQKLVLEGGSAPLAPITDTGSGAVQDKHKMRLSEIVRAINDLFDGDITDGDAVSYVETMKAKLMESPILIEQAAANGKEQFSNSPNLQDELLKAIIAAMSANQGMSRQALNSETVRSRMLSILLGPAGLWEGLREARPAGGAAAA